MKLVPALMGALCQVAHTIIPWRAIHAEAMPVDADAFRYEWPVDWKVIIDHNLQATDVTKWHQASIKLDLLMGGDDLQSADGQSIIKGR